MMNDLKLTKGQDAARAMVAAKPPVSFIVGYAGTGKTTMIKVLAEELGGLNVLTPTGKAALRVGEATGLPAKTIHRWLYKPTEDPETGEIKFHRTPLEEIERPPSGVVLIDEASMLGPEIWEDVRNTCEALGFSLVLVGDGFQLPPVMPGRREEFSTMTEAFAAGLQAPRSELTEVLRQAKESEIVRASMELRRGGGIGAFRNLRRLSPQELPHVTRRTYECGGVTICHKNATRHVLNHGVRRELGISGIPREGEPLMVLKNDYDVGVYNGEQIPFSGWADRPGDAVEVTDRYTKRKDRLSYGAALVNGVRVSVCPEQVAGRAEVGERAVASGGWRMAEKHLHANYGYVYTAHKSQGSQWPYVVVVLEGSVSMGYEDGRRWAYTALTRASEKACYFAGDPS